MLEEKEEEEEEEEDAEEDQRRRRRSWRRRALSISPYLERDELLHDALPRVGAHGLRVAVLLTHAGGHPPQRRAGVVLRRVRELHRPDVGPDRQRSSCHPRTLNPDFLNEMPSYDAASITCEALPERGGRRWSGAPACR